MSSSTPSEATKEVTFDSGLDPLIIAENNRLAFNKCVVKMNMSVFCWIVEFFAPFSANDTGTVGFSAVFSFPSFWALAQVS